jgi:hypothetical protein
LGAVNAAIFKTIVGIARTEGLLTDPVFTAKIFYEGRKIFFDEKIEGNVLIHSFRRRSRINRFPRRNLKKSLIWKKNLRGA